MLKASKRIVDSIQLFSDKGKRHLDRQKELHMIPVQAVDVVFTIKSTIHDQFYLRKTKDIQFIEQMTDCFGIRDITSEFSVVEREV